MTKERKSKKISKKDPGAMHLRLAFKLGRTVRKVSQTADKVKKAARRRLVSKEPADPMSLVIKEIKAIADISGLTAVIEEMNQVGLKHSRHPVVYRLTKKINQLPPAQQEMLAIKFIDKLKENPYLDNSFNTFGQASEMTEKECQKISQAFIDSLFSTLEEIGLTSQERQFLQKYSDEMTRPINDLVQFYLHPKTLSQKVKRLWRMQRIFMKIIKLARMTNDLAMANGEAMKSGFGPGNVMLPPESSFISRT
jgi:hypothetical protein